MLDHPVLPDESLAADVARERLFSGVKTHVTPEVSLVIKLFGADVTLVRLVAGVLREMLLKTIFKILFHLKKIIRGTVL